MSKNFSNLFILSFVLFFVFGCGWVQTVQDTVQGNQNANVEDKARETLGLKKTGVAECDEVVEILDRKRRGNSNTEESWQDKAISELVKQQIYNYINDGNANKSPKEKEDLANKCKTALSYLKDEPKMKDEPKK
jgi:hypothetical protein